MRDPECKPHTSTKNTQFTRSHTTLNRTENKDTVTLLDPVGAEKASCLEGKKISQKSCSRCLHTGKPYMILTHHKGRRA